MTQTQLDTPEARVLMVSRLPRVVYALFSGAALALAGAAMQALLRNPLAEPFTLGLSGGSTLAVLLLVHFGGGLTAFAGASAVLLPFVSLAGALATLALVLFLGRLASATGQNVIGGRVRPDVLILCGVIMNTLAGSAIILVQYLSNPFEATALLRWMMGGVDVAAFGPSVFVCVGLLVGGGTILASWRTLDLIRLGDAPAHHLGLNVDRARGILLVAAALLTAMVVCHAGPIAFVGLVVPHMVRVATGGRHRLLLPASLFFGGAFLAFADAAARTILAPAELPVGILTALLGGPFFLGLLIFRRAPA
jgi:iron complex transport system permease protein